MLTGGTSMLPEDRIAVLMTCHNRKERTLSSLRRLMGCQLPAGVTLDVFLVDDGSSDGTGDMVRDIFPPVHVIEGSGDLYWAGGMRLAWSRAASNDYDYYLWLNDDTLIFEDSLSVLLSAARKTDNRSIICSAVVSEKTGIVTYGGKMREASEYHQPAGELAECEIISGNCVLIPRYVYESVGSIDECFTHAIGDYDYGLRARKKGVRSYVAPKVIGNCENNPRPPKWCQAEVPFFQRLKALYSPLGYAQPKPYFIYISRHFGLPEALKQLVSMHIRVVFPWLWKEKRRIS